MATLRCIVVTPEATTVDREATFVALPLYDGEIGIAPRRQPLIGRLTFGEMRLVTADKTHRFYVDGGFVKVQDNTVTILTNRAIPAEQVNAAAAEKQLEEARKRPAHTEQLRAIRDRLVQQARAQLRVARHAGAR